MLGGLFISGGIARMVSNIVSKLSSGLGDLINRLVNTWPGKINDGANHTDDFGSHITNKRVKLNLADDCELRWLNNHELSNLIAEYDEFRDAFGFVWDFINSKPPDPATDGVLLPLLSTVVGNAEGLALRQDDGEHDIRHPFLTLVSNAFRSLDAVYNIGHIVGVKDQYHEVPHGMHYGLSPGDINSFAQVRDLMSAPHLSTVCNEIMTMAGIQKKSNVSVDFMNRVVLDMEAILGGIPMPSFVVSTGFHKRLRQTYPPPVRGYWESALLVPGRFPDVEVTTESYTGEVTPRYPHTPRDKSGKMARAHSQLLDWSIRKQTPEQLALNVGVGSNVYHAIQCAPMAGLKSQSPLGTREYIGTIRAALQSRKAYISQARRKRIDITRPRKAVGFGKSAATLQPRSHGGAGAPRLAQHVVKFPRRYPTTQKMNDKAIPSHYRFFDMAEIKTEAYSRHQIPNKNDELANYSVRRPQRLRQPNFDHLKDRKLSHISANEIFSMPSQSLFQISDEKKSAMALLMQQEELRARQVVEQAAQRKIEERLAQSGGLRLPRQSFISPLAAEWTSRARDTLRAAAAATLATTGESVELKRHDFAKVVPPTEWLNDEIVNGSLNWLDKAINSAAGIKDPKKQTRKCLSMSSFFLKRLQEQGVTKTQRTLRRSGVEKSNISAVETILVPICERSHWTLLVIRPNKKTVAHMDSLNPRGSPAYTNLGLAWMKDVLEDGFHEEEWEVVRHDAPMQTNGYDCGVHTITNAMCVALGLSPADSYSAEDMPLQRLRIACMLLNSGFTGDFDLRVY